MSGTRLGRLRDICFRFPAVRLLIASFINRRAHALGLVIYAPGLAVERRRSVLLRPQNSFFIQKSSEEEISATGLACLRLLRPLSRLTGSTIITWLFETHRCAWLSYYNSDDDLHTFSAVAGHYDTGKLVLFSDGRIRLSSLSH